ncbi:MAG: hypothetical protein CMJ83_00865 [Planctomycetes bacterium]|nr:hypothetical protein [Planctomycetota bacterium]
MSTEPQPQTDLSPDALSEMMAEFSKPAAQHELLARMAGTFEATHRFWAFPGQDPMVSEGVSTSELRFGGRYLATTYVCEAMGFEGRGLVGYDKASEQYVSTWHDNMGTNVMVAKGNLREDGALELCGDDLCPQTKKPMTVRQVYYFDDANHMRWEMHMGTDEGEAKSMDCEYRKRV